MSEGYAVVLAALEQHARHLTALADDMGPAADSARTTLPSDSLGAVGQPFTALMDQLVTAGNAAVQAGISAMHATGAGVRESANMLENQESGHVSTFDGEMAHPGQQAPPPSDEPRARGLLAHDQAHTAQQRSGKP
jgi:hypothetical protein